jgi:hypothetical protein
MTRKQNPMPSDRPGPSPRMMARIAEAKLRNAARPERPADFQPAAGELRHHTHDSK